MCCDTVPLPCESFIYLLLFEEVFGGVHAILSFLLGGINGSGGIFLHTCYGGVGLCLYVTCHIAGYAFSLFEGGGYGSDCAGHTYLIGVRLDLIEVSAGFGELTAGHEILHISDTLLHVFGRSGRLDIIENGGSFFVGHYHCFVDYYTFYYVSAISCIGSGIFSFVTTGNHCCSSYYCHREN